MDTERIITGLVDSPKYKERADVRIVVDEAIGELREETSRAKVKGILDDLKARLSEVLGIEGEANGNTDSGVEQNSLTITEFGMHLSRLNLTGVERVKLSEMLSNANYIKAKETAEEICPGCKIPDQGKILAELQKLPVKRLKEICEMMEEPTLLIVPDNSFDQKVAGMNGNKHYNHQDGQDDAYVNSGSDSPYKNAPKMTKMKVSIVDGIIHPKPPAAGVSNKLGARRDYFTSLFQAKNMRHIDKDEYAVLLQRSLREAGVSGDNNKIIDNWESGNGTVTFFNPATLTSTALVAYGFFYSHIRQAYFNANNPVTADDHLRGRASVQVFEYMA
jgi:hypothetical protein